MPDACFFLPVGDGHRLWVETRGNPAGEPVLVLHGGPGSGCSPRLAALYDEARHWLVLPDQRGAGLSEPAGERAANTTAHLIADLETLRQHLGIARWRVTGGSWGATLAIAYAAAHRDAVSDLVLRSVFIPSRARVDAFFGGELPLDGLAADLDHVDPVVARAAALAWWRHELGMAGASAAATADDGALDRLVLKYRLQAHYLRAECFLGEAAFFAACSRLAGVPVSLVHGREDRVCPPYSAEAVHARLPGSRLVWVEGCGHDPFHPAMQAAWRVALLSSD
ncbi:MAG: alpha/beta fold hydrolase [Zoogloea sp.]|nr:alpha/beta fold hydrolase [Zoogloea sp.]